MKSITIITATIALAFAVIDCDDAAPGPIQRPTPTPTAAGSTPPQPGDTPTATELEEQAQAPSDLPGGRIAFSRQINGNDEIFVIDSDGGNEVRLTDNGARDLEPEWSPDGTKIAFSSNRDGDFDIYVMDADGQNLQRITNDPAQDSSPKWSPNGARIAFFRARLPTFLWVMDANGANQKPVLQHATESPFCGGGGFPGGGSPDSQQITFFVAKPVDGGETLGQICVVRLDDSGLKVLANDPPNFDVESVWSHDGTRVAFRSARGDENSEVHIMAADGSAKRNVTQGRCPGPQGLEWSPTGDLLACIGTGSAARPQTLVTVFDLEGRLLLRLQHSGAFRSYLAWAAKFASMWSPDGRNLAYVVDEEFRPVLEEDPPGEAPVLVITDAIRGIITSIVGGQQPRWSADGSRIAFGSGNGVDAEICVMNADGTEQTTLTNNSVWDGEPAWSPDGSRIAFVSGYDIHVMNADGSGLINLTSNLAPVELEEPAWSPDGSKIVFVSGSHGNEEIYVMNADGTDQTRLTDSPAAETQPVWSPDGSKIAFGVTERAGDIVGPGNIYVMNADGTGQTRLTDDRAWDPVWSPDGARIAFVSGLDGPYDIYVMNADGSGQTNVTNNSVSDDGPAWSSDGSKIAFVSRDGDREIYVMNADGSALTRLTVNGAYDDYPAWSP